VIALDKVDSRKKQQGDQAYQTEQQNKQAPSTFLGPDH
jgi:hypothetical protein